MTKLEIINETVTYYSEDVNRRARNIKDGGCFYQTNSGKRCAFGRVMTEECVETYSDFGEYVPALIREELGGSVESIEEDYIVNTLVKDEYKGHPVRFWKDLQMLHDPDENWNDEGLSKMGKEFIELLKRRYS